MKLVCPKPIFACFSEQTHTYTMKDSLLRRLADQPEAFDHLLLGLTDEQLRQRILPDKWSILENIAHLGRYQEVFLERMQQINTDENPLFERYAADNDPGFAEWTRLPIPELTARLRGERATLNAFLSILRHEQLARTGQHPTFGPMTVEGWTEFFLLHEAHHLFTILRLVGALRATNTH